VKAVVIYQPGTASMDTIRATYPRHKQLVDEFAGRREILAIGTFDGGRDGSMGVFKDRAAAEAFLARDPFVQEGLVGSYAVKDWNDTLLP
jgi:uncharacterized protein YciI